MIRSGNFQQFDYDDKFLNWLHYSQTTPPVFDLQKITVDINMYLSKGDTTTTYENVVMLKERLPTVREFYVIEEFKHSDFVYNDAAAELIYRKVISDMSRAGKTIGQIYTPRKVEEVNNPSENGERESRHENDQGSELGREHGDGKGNEHDSEHQSEQIVSDP